MTPPDAGKSPYVTIYIVRSQAEHIARLCEKHGAYYAPTHMSNVALRRIREALGEA